MTDTETAVFAAGCFWGVEATFQKIPGVVKTRVGYTGGHTQNPSYESICRGDTEHAEAVEVQYDPDAINYAALLAAFWKLHDPTQLNRQGPDVGRQYRSAIFYRDETQQQTAQTSKDDEQQRQKRPIATEIVAAATFWQAEEYHQSYVQKRRKLGFF